MLLQVALAGKTTVAYFTSEWFQKQMDCLIVSGQVNLLSESLPALVTVMRFLARVNYHMLLQGLALCELLVACGADVSLSIVVCPFMLLQFLF